MKNRGVLLTKVNSFMIVLTFFSLWLAVQFEEAVENILAYILILSFGILHGANDLKLIQHFDTSLLTGKGYLKTLFYYILFVLGSALLFYFIPAIALFLFVLFSGYHFGEQHWAKHIGIRTIPSSVLFLVYGLFILCLLFYVHAETVTNIIETITGIAILKTYYFYATLFSGVAAAALFLFLTHQNKKLRSSFIKEVFYIGVFFVVFSTASLLWSFAIYFVIWHSIPSLVDQIHYLYGHLSKETISNYVRSSFPYWIISVMGICIVLYVFKDNFETSLSFFFAFLSAITFPHILVINRINNS